MCHPFSSMFHHLTCLGTCWKPAPGSGCGGVGGMDGDATTPGGFERRGTFFCHGGPIGPVFFWVISTRKTYENLWKPWGEGKNMVDFKQNWWRMSTNSTEKEHWSTNPPGFFSSTDGLGHLNLGEVWKQSAVNLLVSRCFKRNKQTNRFSQID